MEPTPTEPDNSQTEPQEIQNEGYSGIWVFALILGGLLLMAKLFTVPDANHPYNDQLNNPYQNPFSQNPNLPPDNFSNLLIQELSAAKPETKNSLDAKPAKNRGEIYRQNVQSAVFIAVQGTGTVYETGTHFMGSGIVLVSAKYGFCVLTAEHLLQSRYYKPNNQLLVYFQGNPNPQKVKIAAQSKNYDAMILQFSDPEFKPVKTAVIGQSALLNVGTDVFVIGSCSAGAFLFTSGYVCGKVSKITDFAFKWPTKILMNINIVSGFSGGPVYNQLGELVGMTIGTYVEPAGSITAGLPIDDLRKDFSNDF